MVWDADETFDGWAHCTIGTGDSACTCWREWPRLTDDSDDPAFAEDVPETDNRPARLDWRSVVSAFGKVLIATGLLLAGFVAYQLWGTGIEARRAQNALEEEFESLLAATSTTSAPSTTAVTPASSAPVGTVSDTVLETVPATVPAPTTVPIAEGDPVARLEIPEIGVDVVVVAGVSVDDLRRGPGHYPDTPLPGQYGNAAIAGHRMTYDGPFQNIDDLEPGNEIVVTTLAGRFVYEVTGTDIVEPTDTDVVATNNPDIAELTLTSCHPKWSTRQRIIVHSLLIADQSAPVSYARGAGSTTTTTVSPATTVATATSTTTTAATVAPPTTSGGSDGAPSVTTPAAEAFADGWFHDRSAIPQVVLWALVVAAIAIGARMVRRLVGRRLVGIAVGIVPFLIALYFFYENINRLLPPSL